MAPTFFLCILGILKFCNTKTFSPINQYFDHLKPQNGPYSEQKSWIFIYLSWLNITTLIHINYTTLKYLASALPSSIPGLELGMTIMDNYDWSMCDQFEWHLDVDVIHPQEDSTTTTTYMTEHSSSVKCN